MTFWKAGLGLLAIGCTRTLPPPSALGGISLTSDVNAIRAEVTATAPTLVVDHRVAAGLFPAGALNLAGGLGKHMAVDARLRVMSVSAAALPGVWLRTRVGTERRTTLACRLGASLGLGDFNGFAPFRMPYAGYSGHLQVNHTFLTQRGRRLRVGLTGGGEHLIPSNALNLRNSDGDPVTAEQAVWWNVGVRSELPTRSGHAAIVGLTGHGLDESFLGFQLDVGFRFRNREDRRPSRQSRNSASVSYDGGR